MQQSYDPNTYLRIIYPVKKFITPPILLATLLMLTAPKSYADIEIRFNEGAPKDIFTLENMSECNLNDVMLEIDLSNSAGKLIFDTTATGAGVQVFQPFEVRHGSMSLSSATEVRDGESGLSVKIDQINAGNSVSFTIDVDDTLPRGELGNIRVSGSEIEGGAVYLSLPDTDRVAANFSKDATATLKVNHLCSTTSN